MLGDAVIPYEAFENLFGIQIIKTFLVGTGTMNGRLFFTFRWGDEQIAINSLAMLYNSAIHITTLSYAYICPHLIL